MDNGITDTERERQGLEVQAIALSLHHQGVDSERIYRVLMNGDYDIGNDIIYCIVTLVITEHTGVETIVINEKNIPKMVALAKAMWQSSEGMTEIVQLMGSSDLALRAISMATGVPMRRQGEKQDIVIGESKFF